VRYLVVEMVAQYVSRSSTALAKVMDEIGVGKLAEDTDIHRTQLWRYSTGRSKPDADQIAKLHRATGGRVAADGWETLAQSDTEEDARPAEPKPAGNPSAAE